MRKLLQKSTTLALRPLGVRVVGSDWGPRGFASSLARAKKCGFKPRTVIDVGASDGRWMLECAAIFPDSNYALFDPLPENVAVLGEIARSSSGSTYWSGALGPAAGTMQLNVHGHQSSFFSSNEFKGTPIDVEVRALDSFIEPMQFQAPMLLKADVQGYELEVIAGAQRCLEMTEVVLLEVSFRRLYEGCPLAHDVIAAMGKWGYRIYDVCAYVQRPRDGELAQADVVFVKNGSRLVESEGWN